MPSLSEPLIDSCTSENVKSSRIWTISLEKAEKLSVNQWESSTLDFGFCPTRVSQLSSLTSVAYFVDFNVSFLLSDAYVLSDFRFVDGVRSCPRLSNLHNALQSSSEAELRLDATY